MNIYGAFFIFDGADKGYISRIERGLTVPTVATLYKIASAMGMTVELRPA